MAQLDTRIPMQVPNVLAQQAKVTQNNRLAAQSLGEGFNAVQRGMEAPMRRNMLAAQVQGAGIQNTQQEQAMLGQVLEKVAGNPETWGAARQFLVGNGIFEEGELPEQLTEQTFRELSAVAFTPAEELTAGMQEYNFARQQGYQGTFADWKTLNKSGTSVNVNTGGQPGFPGLNKLETGLTYVYDDNNLPRKNPDGTPMVRAIPGTKAAREQAAETREVADAASQSQAALGKAVDSIATIDGLLNQPGFDRLYGAFDTRFGRIPIPDELVPNMPGGDAANAEAYLNQIEGQAFLQAFENLKGGGQITEIEGKKATEAISRATNRGQSPEAAREALEELRTIAERGAEREIRKQNPKLEFDGVKIMNGMVFISRNGEWFQKQ